MSAQKKRLKEVIQRLYKPLPGPRQAFALSRADAEQLPRLSSVAVISITASDRLPAQLGGFEHLLRLSFSDVDHLNPNISPRARERVPDAFTTAHARQIREFVDALPAAITTVVVHCEGGYSRSCAVVLGLHRLLGYQVDVDALKQANQSVLRLLTGQ
ncbi:hypothetical protein [Pandoraea sp. NPDC090278]|uniref:hypothetical protein n=1 Tax=Pandoraea sp. NPDC090278 TaxID=3364391 RepID=UPI00383B40B7